MYALDFEYDGKLLSDFGMMVCSFSDNRSANTTEKGSELKFNLVQSGYGKRFYAAGLQYEDCLTTTFQICKNPEYFTEDHMGITVSEFRALSRWLNRKKFLWFRSFDLNEPEIEKPWFRASFNLARIETGSQTVGVELTMVTDSPFGYGDEEEIELSFTSGNLTKTIIDRSDEDGEICPFTQITCSQSGNVVLSNTLTGCETEIKNCISGEVITISGESMIIGTSNTNHDLANDFNYDFFRIGNTINNRNNVITASVPCSVIIRYRPILKDTL